MMNKRMLATFALYCILFAHARGKVTVCVLCICGENKRITNIFWGVKKANDESNIRIEPESSKSLTLVQHTYVPTLIVY